MPHYRIVTLGCKLNQADSALLEARLRGLGLRRLSEPASAEDATEPAPGATERSAADLVILNTCTVTAGADREARQIARRLRRENPGATLIATGCYAERDPDALRSLPEVDHLVGLRDQAARVEALAAAALGLSPARRGGELGPFGATAGCEPDPATSDRTRAYLKIQDGCDLRCSYCIIPAVRGPSRSVAPGEVLQEIARLTEAGFREIVFTGVNTGDYGRDLDPPLRLHDLLGRALDLPGLGRLRLNSLEPRTVTSEVAARLADGSGRLARHLQIPLQSGSDTVLARMRRPYRTADYMKIVEGLRLSVPEIGLGADVIVGFPGETEREFEATCRFLEASPVNYLHVFSYSARPGTSAANLPDPVHPKVIKERSARLRALGKDLSLRFRRSLVGRDLPVLALREVRADGRLRALSDNFIDLGLDLEGRPAGALFNRLMAARVTAADPADTLARIV